MVGNVIMVKKRINISIKVVVVLISIFFIYRYAQYILVWYVNPNINVDGIKLMTAEDKAKNILGVEDEYVLGINGCAFYLKYNTKGIYLNFLGDIDTDFYRKVNSIKIKNGKYSIYNLKVDDNYEDALKSIQKRGFKPKKELSSDYFWKINVYIILERNYENDTVKSITIGVRDRVASTRVY